MELTTDRIVLRPWRPDDFEPFAAMDFGFNELGLAEIVAFTAVANLRSQRVMQKAGMRFRGEFFDHPAVDSASPLRPHVLYRKARP